MLCFAQFQLKKSWDKTVTEFPGIFKFSSFWKGFVPVGDMRFLPKFFFHFQVCRWHEFVAIKIDKIISSTVIKSSDSSCNFFEREKSASDEFLLYLFEFIPRFIQNFNSSKKKKVERYFLYEWLSSNKSLRVLFKWQMWNLNLWKTLAIIAIFVKVGDVHSMIRVNQVLVACSLKKNSIHLVHFSIRSNLIDWICCCDQWLLILMADG